MKTVEALINAHDYEGAAYIIGLTGEIALKAVISKRLNFSEYPPKTTTKNQQNYLRTHDHQELVVLAGLSGVFSPTANTPEALNWSEYTNQYRGDWISRLRYHDEGTGRSIVITDDEVKRLYEVLISDENSIIKYIQRKRLW